MLPLGDELRAIVRDMEPAMARGRREARVAAVKRWNWISDDPADAERLRLCEAFADWIWRCRYQDGPFDFGDEADFRHGFNLFATMAARRYSRARPCTLSIAREQFGWRSLLYQLKARVEVKPIAEQELKAAGLDQTA